MNGKIEIKTTTKEDIETLMNIRLEMLRIVNCMKDGENFSEELIQSARKYFLNGEQTTVLALDNEKAIGCASISYITIMPTFDHPNGKRAHLMNVYTNKAYRKRGIATKMIQILIDEAKKKGCTEITLDATDMGRPLYKKVGFSENREGMNLQLR